MALLCLGKAGLSCKIYFILKPFGNILNGFHEIKFGNIQIEFKIFFQIRQGSFVRISKNLFF